MKPFHALFCLVLALSACTTAPRPAPPVAKPAAAQESLATCLARSGVRLYGASWCHWCHVQLELFGSDAPKVPYTDCQPKGALQLLPECVEKGLGTDKGFPTWFFQDGSWIVGVQKLDWLARKTGCPAP